MALPNEQLRRTLAETAREVLRSPAAEALGGLSLCLRHGGEEVLREGYGGFSAERSGGIASGTKWLIAALALRVCTQCPARLSLDARPAELLPGWGADDPRKARITLRMLLAHTSGLPGTDPSVGADGLTLREAALRIGTLPLLAEPGTSFYYGECGFSVAGAMLEAATGLHIHAALRNFLTGPLGMLQTSLSSAGSAAPENPHLGGAAISSATDYVRLPERLLACLRGESDFIAGPLVAAMFADQTAHCARPFAYTPYTLLGPQRARRGYGLGCWREEVAADGTLAVAGSQGRSGFSPWLDFATGLCGTLYAEADFIRVTPLYEQLRAALSRTCLRLR